VSNDKTASSESALIAARKAKAERVKARGENPFANDVTGGSLPLSSLASVREHHQNELLEGGKYDKAQVVAKAASFRVAGRILFLRSFGAGAFVRLRDRTGELQLYCQESTLGAEFGRLDDLDLGDFVEAEGLTTATDTVLRFQIPDAVLPCTLQRGRLAIRINAPSRDVTVGAFRDGEPVVLERMSEPNGVFDIDLGPEHLAIDGGAVPISIAISRTVAERAEDAQGAAPALDKKQYEQQIDTAVSSTWDIDYARLSVDGRTN
jgi:hypothetical protein